ncbi:RHS repeat-associated core domain-containing protein [Hoylesella timonensis]
MNANGFPYNGKYNNDYKKMQFYYHPDHLGSSSYITNLDGEVMQHIEYVPYGEVFIDELELTRKSAAAGKANCNNTWNTPYRFNDCANEGRGKLACSMPSAANRRVTLNDCANEGRGNLACSMPSAANHRVELNAKEFDEETGMYYYGARYYEPRLSLWMSVDRFAEKYYNISPYSFGADNPLISIDINGDSLFVLTAPKGAGGYGHMAILIQTKDKKWALFSKNGTNDWSGISGENNKGDDRGTSIFNSPKEFLRSSKNPVDSKTKQPEYTEGYLIPATTQQDEAAKRGALEELNKNYNVLGSNCAKTVQNALEKAGKKPGELSYEDLKSTPFMNPIGDLVNKIIDRKTPNLIYSRIKKQNKGQTIKR